MTATTAAGPRLLDTRDLAALFKVGEPAIRKRIRLGQLGPAIRMGKRYVIRQSALERFLESEEAKAELARR